MPKEEMAASSSPSDRRKTGEWGRFLELHPSSGPAASPVYIPSTKASHVAKLGISKVEKYGSALVGGTSKPQGKG